MMFIARYIPVQRLPPPPEIACICSPMVKVCLNCVESEVARAGYPLKYHVTTKRADQARMTKSTLFHICCQLLAFLWLHPNSALAQSTGRYTDLVR